MMLSRRNGRSASGHPIQPFNSLLRPLAMNDRPSSAGSAYSPQLDRPRETRMNIARILAALIAASLCIAAVAVPASHPTQPNPTPPENPAPAAASAATNAASGSHGAHDLNTADVAAWLDGFLPYALKSGDIAGGVLSIVKDGKVLFQSGYGYADVDRKTPMDPERILTRIGSTSKLFTWTAVMQLVEQGKLDLHRNIDDYLDFKVSPRGGPPITLLDLMNHRGGFEEGLKDILTSDPHSLMSTEAYLKQHPRPKLFPPGSIPAYSNYGAALAGYIVQRISGEPFERYVDQHIFQPLGMLHSTFEQPLPDRLKNRAAQGYRTASQPPQPYELITTAPAGSVAATASDMARFMLAQLQQGQLDGHEILHPQTAQLMQTPSETAPAGFATLAHGFFYETHNGHLVIGHGGDTIVFHTEFDLLPHDGVGIFYSFNSRGRDNAVYGLRKAILDQFMDRYFPKPPESTEPAPLASATTDAHKIAGRYESSRRIEHGFLSVFYLLQQTVIGANPDGTIVTPKQLEPGDTHLREVAPDLWHEIDGPRQLALRTINGTKTVLDSDDPTSVLQALPVHKSAPLNMTVLAASFLILVVAIILWPVSYLVRRHFRPLPPLPPEKHRPRTLLRIAAAADVLWLLAWASVLAPALSLQLDYYTTSRDPLILTLQIAGLIVIALAIVGIWSLWRLVRAGASWPSKIGNALIAFALLGLVWIGFAGGLLGFDLNY
jgi:CubicO group peptidase (beta-lactamase class C family)